MQEDTLETIQEKNQENTPHRRIKSFVRREGRITSAQKTALQELWPKYGLPEEGGEIHFDKLFGRRADTVLEIGFGDGEALLAMAALYPEKNFIGIDVHRPGVGALLALVGKRALTNIRVFCADAIPILQNRIPVASLSAIHLFFPDPWSKKRHNKRRILQPEFCEIIRKNLIIGGAFLLATDWEDYALQMMAVLSKAPGLINAAGAGNYAARHPERPITKFERRGQKLGHGVWDLRFLRTD